MSTLVVDDVVPFENWTAAARASLAFLYRTVGLDVWMVTRLEEPLQRVLYAYPQEAIPSGTALPWEHSFCRSMVSGVGPRVATVTAATPAYRDLRTGLTERVAAYIGVPLVTRSGELFGTLCGVSDRAQPRSLIRFLPQVEMTARLLSSLLPEEDERQPAPSSSPDPVLDRPT
jgi:GAF domain-containing protein